MEINKCNICSGGRCRRIFELPFRDLQGAEENLYVQKLNYCDNCGFLFTANPFSEEQLAGRYRDFSKFEFDSENYILDDSDSYRKRCFRQLNFINAAIGDSFDSVLEVGAASGFNLSLYEGKEVMGIEPSSTNCRCAMEKYDIKMFNGMFSEYVRSGNARKYDLVFLSAVLEHIVNPKNFILQCRDLCNKYMFIEVPTMDYKFDEEPLGMFCEEYVNYFTLESLNNLMHSAGFELLDANIVFGLHENLPAGWPAVSTVWKKSDALPKIMKKPCMDNSLMIKTYIDKNLKLLDNLKEKIDRIPKDEKLAVWGTGHHASMLLANTSLSDKNIVKVYDSDKRKYKYMFNGIKIEGFDENDIFENKIDSVLVATYTAQKAISAILRQYEEKCKIYYLYKDIV